jgi:PQQ-dependent dehydrogenase (s-GDH family)
MRVWSGLVVCVLAAWTASLSARQGPGDVVRASERFTMRVVASGLEGPWEVTLGPDGHLWVTERIGKRVVRVNPADGSKEVLLTLPQVYQSVGQDGLLGLALHPDFGRGGDYVFVAYTYDASPGQDVLPRMAVWRYRYDGTARRLVEPLPILTGLPAHNDHLGGRLIAGPDRRLYLSIGDQGGNWLANRCRLNISLVLPSPSAVAARDWSAYAGKILRFELDGAVPQDNPVIDGVRSHVFSYGHRNPLGLVFGPAGLYDSEHGPEVDDEVNLIVAGRNYGWPRVAGFRDDKVYAYANWTTSAPTTCEELPNTPAPPPSVARQAESTFADARFTPPLRTFFTVDVAPDGQLGTATIAPGGLDVVTRGRGVPGWNDSLLVLSLVRGTVYRLPLTQNGRSVQGPPVETFRTLNRYRDIAVHPDQRTFYLATDASGRVVDTSGALTPALANPGSILAFTYDGAAN